MRGAGGACCVSAGWARWLPDCTERADAAGVPGPAGRLPHSAPCREELCERCGSLRTVLRPVDGGSEVTHLRVAL